MVDAERLKARMAELGLSQSELARRVGVTQSTIYNLTAGKAYGSTHLHRIARELGTTPAYLEGEVDDPDKDAPPPRSAPTVQHVMLPVTLPNEDLLAEMFEGLLAAIGRPLATAELARELAQLLPIGLSQLRGLLPDAVSRHARRATEPAIPASADLEQTR